MRKIPALILAAAIATGAALAGAPAHRARAADPLPAIERAAYSAYGTPKYPEGFAHFDYVNVNAPKGGAIRLTAAGSFDSLNPLILSGTPAAGLFKTFDSLLKSADDEPDAAYGLVAAGLAVAPDFTAVTFALRPEARFHDGSPLTAADLVFSLETLQRLGHPYFRLMLAAVTRAEALDAHHVRFRFRAPDRQMPLVLGRMPILSRAAYAHRRFDQPGLAPVMASGPYRVASIDPGRSITYARVADYWARDLAVNRGMNNFDHLRFDYFRDVLGEVEAVKAGLCDFRTERSAKLWATGYAGPALEAGDLVRRALPVTLAHGMQGLAFNLRRPQFADDRVRQALTLAFDFEWTNRTLFYGAYARSDSFFAGSELAAHGLPGADERALLEPLAASLPAGTLTRDYAPPRAEPPLGLRRNLLQALDLLRAAGWTVRDQQLVRASDGMPFRFEILLQDVGLQRVALPYAETLKRLGIEARVRLADATLYQHRIAAFDFDMAAIEYGRSAVPGQELRDYFSSASADEPGSGNIMGIRSPAVDALIERLLGAPTRRDLVAASRALDRTLLWGHYLIPLWYSPRFQVVHRAGFGQPDAKTLYDFNLGTWWAEPRKPAVPQREASAAQAKG